MHDNMYQSNQTSNLMIKWIFPYILFQIKNIFQHTKEWFLNPFLFAHLMYLFFISVKHNNFQQFPTKWNFQAHQFCSFHVFYKCTYTPIRRKKNYILSSYILLINYFLIFIMLCVFQEFVVSVSDRWPHI